MSFTSLFHAFGPFKIEVKVTFEHTVKKLHLNLMCKSKVKFKSYYYYPPASEAIREVTILTERKNPNTPVIVSKNLSFCLSVCYKL